MNNSVKYCNLIVLLTLLLCSTHSTLAENVTSHSQNGKLPELVWSVPSESANADVLFLEPVVDVPQLGKFFIKFLHYINSTDTTFF